HAGKVGALLSLLFTSWGGNPKNTIKHEKSKTPKPASFPPMERKWANDNGSSTAYRTAVIRDKDGSLGAGPNAYILINDGVNDSIATDEQACEIKPAWNAALCKGDVGRLAINAGGAGGGGRGGGAGAGRGGPGAGRAR